MHRVRCLPRFRRGDEYPERSPARLQIAAITEHRIAGTAAILNAYLPRRTEVALSGHQGVGRAACGGIQQGGDAGCGARSASPIGVSENGGESGENAALSIFKSLGFMWFWRAREDSNP